MAQVMNSEVAIRSFGERSLYLNGFGYTYPFLFWAMDAGWLRSFIADYGVPLMVLVWTALSYALPGKVPHGVPRRLVCPLPWDSKSLYHWTVVKVLLDLARVW